MYSWYLDKDENKYIKDYEPVYVGNEKVTKVFELTPSHQKSYYGKAKILVTDTMIYLLSYQTIVCGINKETNAFYKYWNDWSKTTINHINDFVTAFGLHGFNKKQWLELETEVA